MELATPSKPAQPRFVRWAVVLGIIIVLNIAFVVARAIIFPEPQYSDFCPASLADQPAPQTQSACVSAGGAWNAIAPAPATVGTPQVPRGYCDLTSQCDARYQAAETKYEQKAFAFMIALGIIAIVVGILPIGSSIVSSGLSYGGVASLVIGSGMYWSDAGDWLRLAIALIALAALIYIGLKRFRD